MIEIKPVSMPSPSYAGAHASFHAPAHSPAPSSAGWIIQCDFDGTISLKDVTDTLLQRFGRDGWEELEAAWERGEIGSRECMQKQIALLDMSAEEFVAHLGKVEIDPHFQSFVQTAHQLGAPVQVVSDGLDRAIRVILQRHGLGHIPVVANRLLPEGARGWRLEAPWSSMSCARASANCKCDRLADERAVHGRVLYVGDSTSDFCVSGKADFVLAKYRLIDHCIEKGIAHAAFTDFGEARELMRALIVDRERLVA